MKMEQSVPKRRHIKFRRQVGAKNSSHLPAYEDGTECSETSAYKIQTPRNYPEESILLYSYFPVFFSKFSSVDDGIARSFKQYENKYLVKCSQDRVKGRKWLKSLEVSNNEVVAPDEEG
jgi:hypothetical protein